MRAPALLGPPTSASFEAIGTTCQVLVTDPDALPEATRIVLGHLDVLDRAVSRFRDDSELARLAAAAITGPVTATVSSTTLEYAAAALRAAEHTGGLVDPTVGPLLAATGYDDDLAAVQSRRSAEGSWRSGPDRVADRQWEGRGPGEGSWCSGPDRVADRQWEGRRSGDRGPTASPTAPRPGWRDVRIDPLARTLSVPQGTVLDLGATAKAHAADVTARLLLDRLPGGFLVNLGGDLAVSGPSPRGGWRVGVEALDGTVAEVVTTRTLCLATSSTVRRTWAAPDGHGIRHHIVDPRTGDTARTPWALVTCAAATTLEANTVATAAVVLGDEAPAWLEARGVVARLTDHAGRITTTRGWPSHREAVPA